MTSRIRPQSPTAPPRAFQPTTRTQGVSAASRTASAAALNHVANRATATRATPPNPAVPPARSDLARDSHLNGQTFRVTGQGANPNAGPPVIVVNGIHTRQADAAALARDISRITGRSVDLVYNNSDRNVAGGTVVSRVTEQAWARAEADYNRLPWPARLAMGAEGRNGFILGRATRYTAELGADPATADWAKRNVLQNPPAAQTQANLVLSQLREHNGPVRVVAYSQGAAISAEALRMVERDLVQRHGRSAADQMLSRIQVMTLGGAANAGDFPSRVNVTSVAHQNDIVSQYFGANRGALGRGNVEDFRRFVGEGFGLRQHGNYVGANGNPEVARHMRAWMSNPASGDRNLILPDYRG